MSTNEVYLMPNGNLCYADGRQYVSPEEAVKGAVDYKAPLTTDFFDKLIDSIIEAHFAEREYGINLYTRYKAGEIKLSDLSADDAWAVFQGSCYGDSRAAHWAYKKAHPAASLRFEVRRTQERRRLKRKHR